VYAKHSRLRITVGSWELEVGFQLALAADDEGDRRSKMREVQGAGMEVSAAVGAGSPDVSPEHDATEVNA
jgi:hypothetical protein